MNESVKNISNACNQKAIILNNDDITIMRYKETSKKHANYAITLVAGFTAFALLRST